MTRAIQEMTPNMANPFFIELIGESRAKHLQKIGALTGHSVDVSSVAFSPDGKRIVSGSLDFTVRVWNLPSLAP